MAYWNPYVESKAGVDVVMPTPTISRESFKPDANADFIIDALKSEANRIMTVMAKESISKTGNIFNNQTCKSSLARIESLAKERFGISTTLVGNAKQKTLFATVFIPPTTSNVEVVKELKDTEKDKIKCLEKEIDRIEKSLNVKNIKIDYDKLTISGLPIDYKIIIMCNFELIKSAGLTDQDVATCFLFEIGKIFKELDDFYKPMIESKEFYSKFLTNFTKNKLPFNISLSKAYEDVTGEKLNVADASNVSSLFIVLKSMINRVRARFDTRGDFLGAFGLSLNKACEPVSEDTITETCRMIAVCFLLNTFLCVLMGLIPELIPTLIIPTLGTVIGFWFFVTLLLIYITYNLIGFGILGGEERDSIVSSTASKDIIAQFNKVTKNASEWKNYLTSMAKNNFLVKKLMSILDKKVVNTGEFDAEFNRIKDNYKES